MTTLRAAVEAILGGGGAGTTPSVSSEASSTIEKFVLNREATLAGLVAGTLDYHYYHALDLLAQAQESGDGIPDAFDAHLAALKDEDYKHTEQRREIEARAALIGYDLATAAGDEEGQRRHLDFLKEAFHLSFTHSPEGLLEAMPEVGDTTASGSGTDGGDAAAEDPVAAAMAAPLTVDDALPELAVTPVDTSEHPHLFNTDELLEAKWKSVTSDPEAYNYGDISCFSEAALEWVSEHDGLTDRMRRALLNRLSSATVLGVDMAKLVDHVIDDLNFQDDAMREANQWRNFGDYNLHNYLTLEQLDAVRDAVPRVINTSYFVNAYMQKLFPPSGVDIDNDRAARYAFLETLRGFVDQLGDQFRSRKNTVVYHMIRHKFEDGEFDFEMLHEWLAMPRNASYTKAEAYGPTTSSFRFSPERVACFAGPSESEELELLTAFLEEAFVDANDFAPYDTWISDHHLKPVFAKTKLQAGVGDAAQWSNMLGSAWSVESLRTSVVLEFPSTANKTKFGSADPVSILLDTKNVPELVVKVFEINTTQIARSGGSFNANMDLEGMEPNHEFRYTYDDAPIRRVRREFSFPDLPTRGVFIFLFVGANRICRAAVSKGGLHFVQRMSVAGHVLRILDDTNTPVAGATLFHAGSIYEPDEATGEICVPFTTSEYSQSVNVVLEAGSFSTRVPFTQHCEDYVLDAGIYLDREQLLTGHRATLMLRAALYLSSAGNVRVPVSMVENIELVIKTVDIEGTTASTNVKHFDLSDAREYTYTFSCPDNVQSVSVELTGRVPIVARTEAFSNVHASASFSLNAINKTDAMDDIYLRRTEAGYELVMLDKSGRPQPNKSLALSATNRFLTSSSSATGTTDADGVLKLGHLSDVSQVSTSGKTFDLNHDSVTYRRTMRVTTADTLSFPCLQPELMNSGYFVTLVAMNQAHQVVSSARDAVVVAGGYFRVGPLPIGDYKFSFLRGGNFELIEFSVVAGTDLTLSPAAAGPATTFKLANGKAAQVDTVLEPLHVVEAELDPAGGALTAQIGGVTPTTRVHVMVTHFDAVYKADRLGVSRRDPAVRTFAAQRPGSSFQAATTMSSEQVYIMKRKYADKRAGNMLDRPSLLLNLNDNPGNVGNIPDYVDPEAMRAPARADSDLRRSRPMANAMGAMAPAPPMASRSMARDMMSLASESMAMPMMERRSKKAIGGGFIEMSDAERNSILSSNFRFNMGFLTKSSLVWTNLVPEADGTLRVDLQTDDPDRFADRYCVTVVAVDGYETAIKRVPVTNATKSNRIYRDTRLLAALDAEAHYSEEKRIDAVDGGAAFAFADVTASEYALYDSLGKVYHLYQTLSRETHVKTFAFVLKWGTLTEAEKRAKFSEYVSHELNFFIYKKDPEFFAAVVAPYLAHKKAKTFMDFWLLGDDEGVASYAEPRRFERLNIVEKILLGQRVDGDASLRLVNDLADLLPRDQEGFNALFKIALKAKLDASDQSALDAASNRAASALNPNLSGGGGGGADASGSSDFDRRAAYRQTYQDVAKTVEYGEMNYYKLKVEQCNDPDLVGINQFWRDYANHSLGGGDGAFVSSNFVRAHRTFTEVMFALAVLDLPAALDGDHTFHNADHPRLEITFACPTIVVHKQLSGAEWDAKPIIVTQNYFDPDDHFEYVDNERQDKYLDVGSTLLKTNKVYECEAVVSNITNTPQNLDLLLQIPRGAVPLRGGFYLKGWYARLDAYETATIKYFFYFPCPGRYVHFPVNALKNSVAIAAAEINTLTIVSELPRAYLRNSEEKSWVQVATNDDLETVLAYMESHNIQRLRMRSLAHRCRDKAWFDALVPYIRSRGHYSHALWSYGILHNDAQTIAEYLAHREGFLRSVGDVLATSLATIRPEADFRLQHLEYHPIVYSRAHYFDTSISSQAPQGLRTAYARLLKALTYVRQGTFDERLGLMYYLLSQERVGEAKAVLAGIAADPSINLDDGAPSCAMQFDYLLAYLDFYNTGTLEVAEAIAAKYADHPVARWRKRFREVANQIREARGEAVEDAEGDELSRNQAMSRLAAADPSLSLSVEDDSIVVNYENMEALDVNFFFTDVEVLFSRSPFRESVSSMEVKPNFTTAVELDPEASVFTMAVPDEVRGRNCIIEVSGAGRSDSVSYYSSSLNVQISEAYGQLKVTHADTGAPLRCVYVKVYAQEHGSSVFWKDCYTDLRGKADYATISEKNVSGVSKFSILVLSDEHGASIRACGPPRS